MAEIKGATMKGIAAVGCGISIGGACDGRRLY